MEFAEFLIALLIVSTLPSESDANDLVCDNQDQKHFEEDWHFSVRDSGGWVRIAGMWIESETRLR